MISRKLSVLVQMFLYKVLFINFRARSSDVMESIPKSKKNKRCTLHSLDTHKTKTSG